MAAIGWTLEQLIGEVASALDGSAYAGAPNGRVREVPDARAVRWYTTIGLVDRPTMRGRTALYGPRHLMQIVAIKRRQSQGLKIADIQAELANAPDELLRHLAELPELADRPLPPGARPDYIWHESLPPERRFWVELPVEHHSPPTPARREPGRAELGGAASEVALSEGPPSEVAAPDRAASEIAAPKSAASTGAASESAVAGGAKPALEVQEPKQEREELLSGVPLGGGAVLLLPSTPAPEDLTAIRSAAAELMSVLHDRGLLANEQLGMRGSSA